MSVGVADYKLINSQMEKYLEVTFDPIYEIWPPCIWNFKLINGLDGMNCEKCSKNYWL